jgi:hypothetical protein
MHGLVAFLVTRYRATTSRIDNPPFMTRSSWKDLERHVVQSDIHPEDSRQIGMRLLFHSVAVGAGYKLGVINSWRREATESSSRRCRGPLRNRQIATMAKLFFNSDLGLRPGCLSRAKGQRRSSWSVACAFEAKVLHRKRRQRGLTNRRGVQWGGKGLDWALFDH